MAQDKWNSGGRPPSDRAQGRPPEGRTLAWGLQVRRRGPSREEMGGGHLACEGGSGDPGAGCTFDPPPQSNDLTPAKTMRTIHGN